MMLFPSHYDLHGHLTSSMPISEPNGISACVVVFKPAEKRAYSNRHKRRVCGGVEGKLALYTYSRCRSTQLGPSGKTVDSWTEG